MIVKRHELEKLDRLDVTDAKVLCLCPICAKLSDTLTSDAFLDDVPCPDELCVGMMEILMVDIPAKEIQDDEY